MTDQNHEGWNFRMSMAAKGEVEDSEEDRKADGRGEDRAIGKRRKPKMEGGAFEAKSLYVFYCIVSAPLT